LTGYREAAHVCEIADMPKFNLYFIARKLNALAETHPIGRLPDIRKQLKGLVRHPGRQIFSKQTVFERWAFHHGGRTELQFNIGDDGTDGKELRWGVAFSFTTGPAVHSLDELFQKAAAFNKYLKKNGSSEQFAKMQMWHWDGFADSKPRKPAPISPALMQNGVFVFLGKRKLLSLIDYEQVLTDFDKLLPLYCYVESNCQQQTVPPPTETRFELIPGCVKKKYATTASPAQCEIEVELRHNRIQQCLHDRLTREFGEENVFTEQHPCGFGSKIDLIVRRPKQLLFYEIKTSSTARECIRLAIGQLLEYSYWPGAQQAKKLIVVGEAGLDNEAAEYLHFLRHQLSIPITYEQIKIKKR
jgi:hypothetical protein